MHVLLPWLLVVRFVSGVAGGKGRACGGEMKVAVELVCMWHRMLVCLVIVVCCSVWILVCLVFKVTIFMGSSSEL